MGREIVFLHYEDRPERDYYQECDVVVPSAVLCTEGPILEFIKPLFEGKEVDFKFCRFCHLGDKILDKRI